MEVIRTDWSPKDTSAGMTQVAVVGLTMVRSAHSRPPVLAEEAPMKT